VLHLSHLSYSYPGASLPVFSSVAAVLDRGWTGVVGANGAGKSTLLKVCTGLLEPTQGTVSPSGHALYCDQRTEEPPTDWEDFLNAWDERSIALMDRLGIEYTWQYRWSSLSFGERKRAQLATALWVAPEVLAVDEPTNHLDGDARRMIVAALADWDGVGLLVSHDRAVLDGLCRRTLFLAEGTAVLRPGGVSAGLAEEARERTAALREREETRREVRRLRREAQRRDAISERSRGRLSKKRVGRADADTRARIDLARLTGKDRRAGTAAREMRARADAAEETRRSISVAPATFSPPPGALGIPATVAAGDTVCRLPAGEIVVGQDPPFRVRHPELSVAPGERVGLAGPNGAGKSTVLRHLSAAAHHVPVQVLAQELETGEVRAIRSALDSLSRDERGRVVSLVAQLGSDPERVLDTGFPSPGEARKILIALAVVRPPALMVLDEPTNHLDLPSVMALEATLQVFPGSLIVVSHDERFLAGVSDTHWRLDREGNTATLTVQSSPPRDDSR